MEKILLTTRIRNGDRKAFDELCGRYYAMLVSYARLFMKDDWAEDVVQDVFYNVWQNRAALDDSNSLYKYLLRSVYNRALNYLDKNRRAGDYRAYYQERIASMGSAYYAPDNSPIIRKALFRRPARESRRGDRVAAAQMPRGIQTELPRRPFEPRDQRAARHLAEYGRESYVFGAQTTAPEALQGAACCCCSPCCSCDRKKFAVPSRYFLRGACMLLCKHLKKIRIGTHRRHRIVQHRFCIIQAPESRNDRGRRAAALRMARRTGGAPHLLFRDRRDLERPQNPFVQTGSASAATP